MKLVCQVRSADKQTTSSLSIPSVFSGNCPCRKTPFTPCKRCHWCRECGSRTFQHRLHCWRRVACIQSCAVYAYLRTCTQAWKSKHNCKVAQETSTEHCNWTCNSSCKESGSFGCHGSRGVVVSYDTICRETRRVHVAWGPQFGVW